MSEIKKQFILDEHMKLTEIPAESVLPVEHPINYKLKNAFEVFIRIHGTENYWISNYGRCVNNYRKKTFLKHKEGNVHYTLFEIERDGSTFKRDTSPEKLVADTFLKKSYGRYKIWHKDGDVLNNWYKNLIYVTPDDYKQLKSGNITWEELNLEQEYIEYKNKASHQAYTVRNGIRSRCRGIKRSDGIGECYEDATMCKQWIDEPREFVKWYLNHYYEVDGETMAVDKDLFGDGSKIYGEDTCCILPQALNNLIVNCKKSHGKNEEKENGLPIGVRKKGDKYYGKITLTGTTNTIKLSEWNTPEEAFAEYKIMKQADILLVAAKYKEKIPDYIYDRLLQIEVEPY